MSIFIDEAAAGFKAVLLIYIVEDSIQTSVCSALCPLKYAFI